MIQFRSIPDSDEGHDINMMPLIDIIFNLLIFFVITAVISTRGVNLELPRTETAKQVSAKKWEIVIRKDGTIVFNEVTINLPRLKKIFSQETRHGANLKDKIVVLKADKNISFGLFVSVMDIARKSGFHDLVIATEPSKGGGDN